MRGHYADGSKALPDPDKVTDPVVDIAASRLRNGFWRDYGFATWPDKADTDGYVFETSPTGAICDDSLEVPKRLLLPVVPCVSIVCVQAATPPLRLHP